MDEMKEVKEKKMVMERFVAERRKKVEEIEEKKHQIGLYNKIISIIKQKKIIRIKQHEIQLKDYKFTEHYKPVEVAQTTPEYIDLLKQMQGLMNEEELLKFDEDIRNNERMKQKNVEDLSDVETSLKLIDIELKEKQDEISLLEKGEKQWVKKMMML